MTDAEQVVARLYALAAALDERDWAAVGAAFTPEAGGYGRRGREEIVAVVRAHLGGCGPSQHLLGNPRVTVEGDSARSRTYARVHHRGTGARSDRFYECMGEYDDRWRRTAEGWRLTERRFDIRIELGDVGVLRPPTGGDEGRHLDAPPGG